MKQEISRKALHIIFGIFFLLLIYFLGTRTSFDIILTLFIIGLIIALSIRNGIKIPSIDKILSHVEREHEKHFPGKAALLFFLAAIILLYFFKNEPFIVLVALSLQIFSDSIAALVGKRFGKHILLKRGHYKKTVEGTLTCLIVSLLITLYFLNPLNAVIIAIIATIVELLPVNDNVAMPLVVAIALKLLL